MAGPIYKLWMFKPTEAWYQLSNEERDNNMKRIDEDLKKVGGKRLITCTPTWSTERLLAFGVEEFPNIEAVQEFTSLLLERDHFRYIEVDSMLGSEWVSEQVFALDRQRKSSNLAEWMYEIAQIFPLLERIFQGEAEFAGKIKVYCGGRLTNPFWRSNFGEVAQSAGQRTHEPCVVI